MVETPSCSCVLSAWRLTSSGCDRGRRFILFLSRLLGGASIFEAELPADQIPDTRVDVVMCCAEAHPAVQLVELSGLGLRCNMDVIVDALPKLVSAFLVIHKQG